MKAEIGVESAPIRKVVLIKSPGGPTPLMPAKEELEK
jgi:hypothetical protein